MDLSVLRSGRELFRHCRPILYIEVVESHLERYGHVVEDMEAMLTAYAYAFFRNDGPRNSGNDVFKIRPLPTLRAGGSFFDCLAVPKENVTALGLPRPKNI